jgi:hypothetical protein
LRWGQRISRTAEAHQPAAVAATLRNALIGHADLGLDLQPLLEHLAEYMSEETLVSIVDEVLADWGTPIPSCTAAKIRPSPVKPNIIEPLSSTIDSGAPIAERRAIVCFVEDNWNLIQQLLALRLSWLHSQSPDTDLVVMGPEEVLARLPDDLVKIAQQPATADPVWRDYRYVNSIACLNGPGSEQLERYSHLLRTDVDTFITPAWNDFRPAVFTCGTGGYSNDDDVRGRIRELAAKYGLNHSGMTNIGSTWYGPTEVVRRACAFSEMMTKRLLTHEFAVHEGQWPGWYAGVTLLYAGEIAVNHCAPEAQCSKLLEAHSTSPEPIMRHAHIHCWHTDEKFSKHWFMSRRYTRQDSQDLDMSIIRDYCMALSFRSLDDLAAVRLASACKARING